MIGITLKLDLYSQLDKYIRYVTWRGKIMNKLKLYMELRKDYKNKKLSYLSFVIAKECIFNLPKLSESDKRWANKIVEGLEQSDIAEDFRDEVKRAEKNIEETIKNW